MADSTDQTARASFLPRACENCRKRKVRCDKVVPCSGCQALGIACQATAKPAEARTRVLISGQYEKQIELIQERLHSIEKTLQDVTLHGQAARSSPVAECKTATAQSSPAAAIITFEGDSSFGTKTIQASQAADIAALSENSNEIATALHGLKRSLQSHAVSSRTHDVYLSENASRVSEDDGELLPVGFVLEVVKRMKVKSPLCVVASSWPDHLMLEKLCQKSYFPSEPLPSGSITLMYAVLYYVVREYLLCDSRELAGILGGWDLATFLPVCQQKFESGLESYETFTVPTLENLQVLLLGAMRAQEECKMSLCWTYISAAHAICITRGLHRKSSVRNDSFAVAENKRFIFWTLYSLDKNLSLNLGRTSNFQDSDIDAEYYSFSDDPKQRMWDMFNGFLIRFSAVQGEAYNRLYSVSALKASAEDREKVVNELAAKSIALREELHGWDLTDAYFADYLEAMTLCTDYIIFSVLTVIYQASSSSSNSTISFKCYEAAKRSLKSHLESSSLYRDAPFQDQLEYVIWILLYPSFTPFVVVFTHAIATKDTQDLALLSDTVESLVVLKHLNRGAQRLHDVCRAFLTVAEALINSKHSLNGVQCFEDGSLMLPPMSDASTGFALPQDPDAEGAAGADFDISMILNDWIGTNRPVGDILEFTEFDMN